MRDAGVLTLAHPSLSDSVRLHVAAVLSSSDLRVYR